MKRLRLLITGGTGFLGSHLIPLFEKSKEPKVHLTIISRSSENCLPGDLLLWDGGLDPRKLKGHFDVMIHLAGLSDLRAKREDAYLQNIIATHTAMNIAQKAEIPHFVHASTIAVTMNQRGSNTPIGPDLLPSNASFPDTYSESKAHAEKLVRNWPSHIFESRLILRMGALVGDTQFGRIQRIDGPYLAPLSLKRMVPYLQKLGASFPLLGARDSRLPMVPVDCAAQAIFELVIRTQREKWSGVRGIYVVSDQGPTSEDFFRSTFRHLGLKKELQFFSKLPSWLTKTSAQFLAQLPKEELEYLVNLPSLDLKKTHEILGQDWCPEFSVYERAFWSGYETFLSNR